MPILAHKTRQNGVQAAESAKGDGAAHQPDLPIPAKPVESPSVAVRERQPEDRRPHRGLRRVHELGAGGGRGVLRQEEDQEAAGEDPAQGGQHNANTEREPPSELNITSTCSWGLQTFSVLSLILIT